MARRTVVVKLGDVRAMCQEHSLADDETSIQLSGEPIESVMPFDEKGTALSASDFLAFRLVSNPKQWDGRRIRKTIFDPTAPDSLQFVDVMLFDDDLKRAGLKLVPIDRDSADEIKERADNHYREALRADNHYREALHERGLTQARTVDERAHADAVNAAHHAIDLATLHGRVRRLEAREREMFEHYVKICKRINNLEHMARVAADKLSFVGEPIANAADVDDQDTVMMGSDDPADDMFVQDRKDQ